ncbi:unnamed protein product [Sphagnum tenellum]
MKETMKKLKTMKDLSSREGRQGSRQAEGRVLFCCARKTWKCANSEAVATVLPRLSRRCRASTAHGDADPKDSKESRDRLSRSFVGPWMGALQSEWRYVGPLIGDPWETMGGRL